MSSTVDLNAALRTDALSFVRKAFHTLNPGTPFVDNWHLRAIAYELGLVTEGSDKRLIVNVPPRSLKSVMISVAYAAWRLGHDPTLRIIVASYSQDLANDHARLFKQIVESAWYQAVFPKMHIKRSTTAEITTTMGGGRLATSVGGTLTGRGGDLIIIDDPMKADDALSESARKAVIEWYGGTLISRLNDKRNGAIILIMQRLHEGDLTGHLLDAGGWTHLCLPAIAPHDMDIPIGGSECYQWFEGEPLQEKREPAEILESYKAESGSIRFAAQYLQAPVPTEGNLVKLEWFLRYDTTPSGVGVKTVQSWDCASSTNNAADYSVCVTAVMCKNEIYIIDVWRGRLKYPDLRKKMIAQWERFRPHHIIVELASAGEQLVADLMHNRPAGMPRPLGVRPKDCKKIRFEAASVKIENGEVLLPRDAPWLNEFLHELLAFDNGKYDDQVDAFSQLVKWRQSHSLYQGSMLASKPIICYGT